MKIGSAKSFVSWTVFGLKGAQIINGLESEISLQKIQKETMLLACNSPPDIEISSWKQG